MLHCVGFVCGNAALLILLKRWHFVSHFSVHFLSVVSSFRVAHNVLQLQEVGDFEAQNCLPALNLIRSTKLHLTTEPPISCRCCYQLPFCLTEDCQLIFLITFSTRFLFVSFSMSSSREVSVLMKSFLFLSLIIGIAFSAYIGS